MTKARTLADNFAADINGITAGTGITGGGTSGTVTVTNSMATAIDAAGDLIYGTGSDAFTRLAVGTAGQLLAVNSGATAPEWVAPAAGGANWSLLNAGGTSLTGATTITVSGISNANSIFVLVQGASANANAAMAIRFNSDTASNYIFSAARISAASTYAASNFSGVDATDSGFFFMRLSSNAASTASGYLLLDGANSSGLKIANFAGGATASGGDSNQVNAGGGYYDSSSTISSVSIFSSAGNFDAGTIYVYTTA